MSNEKFSFKAVSYYGGGLLRVPNKEIKGDIWKRSIDSKHSLISILDADRIYRNIDPRVKIPEWWKDAREQASEVRSAGGRPLLVKLPENSYLTTGRYLESVFEWLNIIQSDGVLYDRDIGGVVIDGPHWPKDTNQRMSHHGIGATAVASTWITPETEQGIRMKKAEKQAEDAGFTAPSQSMFPSSEDFKLLKHQIPVVKILANRRKGLLADDVGSGKSAMFICGFLSLVEYRVRHQNKRMEDCFPLVIITKKKLLENTVNECQNWFNGSKTYVVSKYKPEPIPEGTHFIVASVNALPKRKKDIIDANPQGIVCDESHTIKNTTSKQTKAALAISRSIVRKNKDPYTVCASATPMPNRPAELWSQLVFANMSKGIIDYASQRQRFPEYQTVKRDDGTVSRIKTSDHRKFEIRYCSDPRGGFYAGKGASNEHELNRILQHHGMIRRKKSEFITPLPLLIQDFVQCEVSEEYRKKYETAELQFSVHVLNKLKEKAKEEGWSRGKLEYESNRKMRMLTHSEKIMKMTATRQLVGEAKLEPVIEWIERFFKRDPQIVGTDSSRNKLIVFAHHKEIQQAIIDDPRLQKYGVLHIGRDTKNTTEVIDEFQDPESGKNLVVCYSESREGITLTAAKDVLVVEMPFVPSWLIQMGGRCWARISRDYAPHEAYLHYAVSDLGIDEYLKDMIRKKQWLHKKIIDGEKAMGTINEVESSDE